MLQRLARGYHFEGRLENEEVHYIFFKHILSEMREWMMLVFLYIAPFLTLFFLSFFLPATMLSFLWIAAPFYFIFAGTYIFILWLNDICDISLLTNKRIIDITQQGFLNRKTSIAELNNIQNVNYAQRGPIDAMFNIGTVEVQTAGATPDLELDFVEGPSDIADLILSYSRNYKKEQGDASHAPATSLKG